MDDEAKDKVEDTAAAVVEAAVSLVPLLGGPLAIAVNRAYGSAWQRRHAQIVKDLSSKLEELIASGKLSDPVDELSSDDTVAEIERVIRASHESASAEKLKLLRDALAGGIVHGWDDMKHQLMEIVERLSPMESQILFDAGSFLPSFDLMGSISDRRPFRDDLEWTKLRGRFVKHPDDQSYFALAWAHLLREGLIEERVVTDDSSGRASSRTQFRATLAGLELIGMLVAGRGESADF